MIANHIHDALRQVRQLQAFILEKRLFKGYSGKARIASGLTALAGSAVLASSRVPVEPETHVVGWGIILALTLVVNYGCLLYWFLFNDEVRRNPVMLKPALDAIPALAVGGVLTVALIMQAHYDLLFGTWMCLYGLAHTSCHTALPRENWYLGFYYLACGAFFLLWPATTFMNPWPAGIVFLAGEWIGGVVFHRHKIEAMKEYDE